MNTTKSASGGSGGKRHRSGAGYTIPALASLLKIPVSQVRLAVQRGEIKTVPWAGLDRIPPAEAERLAKAFSLDGQKPDSEPEAEPPSQTPNSQKLALLEARIRVLEQYVAAIHADLVALRGDERK